MCPYLEWKVLARNLKRYKMARNLKRYKSFSYSYSLLPILYCTVCTWYFKFCNSWKNEWEMVNHLHNDSTSFEFIWLTASARLCISTILLFSSKWLHVCVRETVYRPRKWSKSFKQHICVPILFYTENEKKYEVVEK